VVRDPGRGGRAGGEEGLGGCGFEEEEEGCVGGDGCGHGAD
jgi:hypothetical protein